MSGSEEEEWGLEAHEGRAARSARAGFRRVDAAGRGKPSRARRRCARRPPRAWKKTPATTLARGASAETACPSVGAQTRVNGAAERSSGARGRTWSETLGCVASIACWKRCPNFMVARGRPAASRVNAGARRSSAQAKHNERNKSDPLEVVNSKRATSARRIPTTIQSVKPENRGVVSRGPRGLVPRKCAFEHLLIEKIFVAIGDSKRGVHRKVTRSDARPQTSSE